MRRFTPTLCLALAACFVSQREVLRELDVDEDGYLPPQAAAYGGQSPWDCKEGDGSIHPFAVEICNDEDDDCDGITDDDCLADTDVSDSEVDSDDGQHAPEITILSPQPDDQVSANWIAIVVHVDEDEPLSELEWLVEIDGSSVDAEVVVQDEDEVKITLPHVNGAEGTVLLSATDADDLQDTAAIDLTFLDLDNDDDGYDPEDLGGTDCNDGRPFVHPNAPENCNGEDDNCDGEPDHSNRCSYCGDLGENPVWSSDKEHHVVCDVSLDPSYTLTIENGTTVSIDGSWEFFLNGDLQVNGGVESPVTFTSGVGDGCGLWGGLLSSASITASFWRVENGPFGTPIIALSETSPGALRADYSSFFCGTVAAGLGGAEVNYSTFIADLDDYPAIIGRDNLEILNSNFIGTHGDGSYGIQCLDDDCLLAAEGNSFVNVDIPVAATAADLENVGSNYFEGASYFKAMSGYAIDEPVYLIDRGLPVVFGGTVAWCDYQDVQIGPAGDLHLDSVDAWFHSGTGIKIGPNGGNLNIKDSLLTQFPSTECVTQTAWTGIAVRNTATLAVENSSIGFATRSVFLDGGSAELTDVLLHDASDVALYCTGGCASYPSLYDTNVSFDNNAQDTN